MVEKGVAAIGKPPAREISARSRLARFKQRCGQSPKVGVNVDVEANANSYWGIVL